MPSASVASSTVTQDVVAPVQPKLSAPKAGKSPQSMSAPDDDRPFAEVRSDLERQARAGDGHAAWQLGMALANCNGYMPISDEELERSMVDAFASGMAVKGATPEAMLQRSKLRAAQRRHDCRNISGLSESDTNSAASIKAFRWMELGASLGDADAQAMYASLAFEAIEHRNALADAERIRERKRLALEILERSLAQGDALALQQFSRHYTEGMLLPANAEMAYRYLYAFSLTPRARDFVPGYLELALSSAAQGFDPIAREQAQEEGRRLATCCLSDMRGQP